MKYTRYTFFLLIFCQSCKIGQVVDDFGAIKKDAMQISSDIKSVRSALVPVDSMMMEVASGLLTGMSEKESEAKLDSIAARISRSLTRYLNESFTQLDPGPMARNLTTGAIEPILDLETEARLKAMIGAVSRQAGDDLSMEIRKLMYELTSPAHKARLQSMFLSVFSVTASDSMSAFINRSLHGIDVQDIGSKLANELIAAKIRPQVDTIVRTAVRAIFEEIQNDPNKNKLFGDIQDILVMGLGVMGIIIGILFWWNRRKSVQLNNMLVNAIEDLDDRIGKDVKKVVERKARQEGLLKNLDSVLERVHLLDRKGDGR